MFKFGKGNYKKASLSDSDFCLYNARNPVKKYSGIQKIFNERKTKNDSAQGGE